MSADRYAWMTDALCAQVGGDEWIDNLSGGGSHNAKRICRACPVRTSCAAHAARLEVYDGTAIRGVWGGRTHNQKCQQLKEAA